MMFTLEREDVSSDGGEGGATKQDVDSSDVDINAMLEELEVRFRRPRARFLSGSLNFLSVVNASALFGLL